MKCVFVFNSVVYLSFLNEIGQHDNNWDVLFANHSQEIRNGHVVRALCCDVGTTSVNTLKRSRKLQICNWGCQKNNILPRCEKRWCSRGRLDLRGCSNALCCRCLQGNTPVKLVCDVTETWRQSLQGNILLNLFLRIVASRFPSLVCRSSPEGTDLKKLNVLHDVTLKHESTTVRIKSLSTYSKLFCKSAILKCKFLNMTWQVWYGNGAGA